MVTKAVFIAHADVTKFRVFVFANEDDAAKLPDVDGRSFARGWTPIPVRSFDEKGGSQKPIADVSGMLPLLLFSQKAYDGSRRALDTCGEFLPFIWKEKTLWGLNVTKTIDCLDENGSTITRFRSGGIMEIKKYAFKESSDHGMSFFKLPQFLRGPLLATQAAERLILDLGLSGIHFQSL